MPSFRILDQFPVYLDRLGVPVSGGSLRFYQSGTDTPQDVYGDPDLTVNNGDSVLLSSDGRTTVDVWGSGAYRVRLFAADGTLIKEADDVEIPGGSGTVIPALLTGYYLTNDGSSLIWSPVREVPDPTGQSGKILTNDGTNLFWQDAPAPFSPAIDTGSIKLGTKLIQWGTGTASPSGSYVTTKAIAFPKAFTAVQSLVICAAQGSGAASNGGIPIIGYTGLSNTGAVANIDMNAFGNIVNAVTFSWLAIGDA